MLIIQVTTGRLTFMSQGRKSPLCRFPLCIYIWVYNGYSEGPKGAKTGGEVLGGGQQDPVRSLGCSKLPGSKGLWRGWLAVQRFSIFHISDIFCRYFLPWRCCNILLTSEIMSPWAMSIDWVKVLRPTWHKIGHFGDVPKPISWFGITHNKSRHSPIKRNAL